MGSRTQLEDAQLLALIDEAPSGLIVVRNGLLAHASRQCAQAIACRCAGVGDYARLPSDSCLSLCARLREAAWACEQSGTSVVVELEGTEGREDGEAPTRLEITLRSARLAGQTVAVGTVRELARRATAAEGRALGWRAHHDSLTGLPNRTLLRERLSALLTAKPQADGGTTPPRPFALLMIDLDGFKAVNDTAGHEAGDRVLTVTAQRFLDAVRSSDTVARIGGDEFAVLLPGVESAEQAARVVKGLILALEEPILIGDHSFEIGCSTGIALYPTDGSSTDTLLVRADAAMYAAKRAGRNRYFAHGEQAVEAAPAGAASALTTALVTQDLARVAGARRRTRAHAA